MKSVGNRKPKCAEVAAEDIVTRLCWDLLGMDHEGGLQRETSMEVDQNSKSRMITDW